MNEASNYVALFHWALQVKLINASKKGILHEYLITIVFHVWY
jgi:hypothetical protein